MALRPDIGINCVEEKKDIGKELAEHIHSLHRMHYKHTYEYVEPFVLGEKMDLIWECFEKELKKIYLPPSLWKPTCEMRWFKTTFEVYFFTPYDLQMVNTGLLVGEGILGTIAKMQQLILISQVPYEKNLWPVVKIVSVYHFEKKKGGV